MIRKPIPLDNALSSKYCLHLHGSDIDSALARAAVFRCCTRMLLADLDLLLFGGAIALHKFAAHGFNVIFRLQSSLNGEQWKNIIESARNYRSVAGIIIPYDQLEDIDRKSLLAYKSDTLYPRIIISPGMDRRMPTSFRDISDVISGVFGDVSDSVSIPESMFRLLPLPPRARELLLRADSKFIEHIAPIFDRNGCVIIPIMNFSHCINHESVADFLTRALNLWKHKDEVDMIE